MGGTIPMRYDIHSQTHKHTLSGEAAAAQRIEGGPFQCLLPGLQTCKAWQLF